MSFFKNWLVAINVDDLREHFPEAACNNSLLVSLEFNYFLLQFLDLQYFILCFFVKYRKLVIEFSIVAMFDNKVAKLALADLFCD